MRSLPTRLAVPLLFPVLALIALLLAFKTPIAQASPAPRPLAALASVRIHDIQGLSHISPYNGSVVTNVLGIVTARRSNGFYIQDPNPDANDGTSEAIFIFTSSMPTVTVGDAVEVTGRVTEFRAGDSGSNNLTTSQIARNSGSPSFVSVLSNTNPLPAATIIGTGGRIPPHQVIEDDASGSVETSGVFDPADDGIDFYESLEAMRVQVNDAVAVGPTNDFGEIPVLPDNGAHASPNNRTTRGGILVSSNDFNPERIIVDDALVSSEPLVNVGDTFPGAIVGVMDYDFSNFKLLNTSALPTPTSAGITREVTGLTGNAAGLTVASFNVENLDAAEPDATFDTLAGLIVDHLQSPDVIAVEEIQDNDGPANTSQTDASQTYTKLIEAIEEAGGPTYDYRQVDPVDDQDGGAPGGNIRVGFLFNPARVDFVDRTGGTPTTANSVGSDAYGAHLTYSPGRVDPTNAAWNASRKPLAGEFVFNGHRLILIANHFASKTGDQPLFGRFQPPTRGTEVQRHQQAQVVNDFVDSILAVDPDANVVVLGDLNDFEFSQTMQILEGSPEVLHDLVSTLPKAERYTYVFDGNSQALDHIVVSTHLSDTAAVEYDIVHVNAEFHDQASDHDPEVARFNLAAPELAFDSANYDAGESNGSRTVTVTLGAAAATTVTVDFNAGDGTATGGSDYTPISGTLTFAIGDTSETFNVAILGDTLDEADETVDLDLSNPAGGAVLGTQSSATLTILDDDASPTLTINDRTADEGHPVSVGGSGTTPFVFTVSLSEPSGREVTAAYSTANGTAMAGSDYVATSGVVTFTPGTTTRPVTVTVVGDLADEANETFFVNIGTTNGATVADGQGRGTIRDDDRLVDNEALNVRYDGWIRLRDPQASKNAYMLGKGRYERISYQAPNRSTSITWITYLGPNQGIARVIVDGVVQGNYDLYSPTPVYLHSIAFDGLPLRRHTIEIVVLDLKNSASSGRYVRADAFRSGSYFVQAEGLAVTYNGWVGVTSAGALGGNYRMTETNGDAVFFTVLGDRFTWITDRGPDRGLAQITVDREPLQAVDLYSPTAQQQVEIAVTGLGPGPHSIKITALGTKGPQSSGRRVVFDGFREP